MSNVSISLHTLRSFMFLIRDCEILGRCRSLKSETSRYLISADTDFKRKRKDYYFILCCYLFQRETKKSFFKRITNNSEYFGFTFVHSSRYCFSNGPQKCSACIKEDIFEDPTSILKQGCVSISDRAIRVILVKPKKNDFAYFVASGFPRQRRAKGSRTPSGRVYQRKLHLERKH